MSLVQTRSVLFPPDDNIVTHALRPIKYRYTRAQEAGLFQVYMKFAYDPYQISKVFVAGVTSCRPDVLQYKASGACSSSGTAQASLASCC